MKIFMMGFIVFACALPTWAQKFTVKKIKGNQAVVEINDGVLGMNRQYDITPRSEDEVQLEGGSTGPRAHFIGIGTSLKSITGVSAKTGISSMKSETGSTSSSTNAYGVEGYYGWNKRTLEFGVKGLIGSSDTGSGATMTLGAGGILDWNFKPNKPGNDMIFGIGTDADYVVLNPPSGGTSSNIMAFYPHGYMKWFVLGTGACIRMNAGFAYAERASGGVKTKDSGMDLRAGLYVYF